MTWFYIVLLFLFAQNFDNDQFWAISLIQKFNVVELNNGNRATILEMLDGKYLAEIVNSYGITLDKRIITENEINKTDI